MTADLKLACKDLERARQKHRDALKTNTIQDQCIVSLTAELEEAKAARDCAQAEIEQLRVSNQQLLSATGQDAANAGMVELKRQLDQANQQLASQGNASSTHALVERCKEFEEKLQLSDQELRETCDAGGLDQMEIRLHSMAGECDAALKRELLTEGRTLEAQHQELKVQLSTTTTEFESRLRVINIELGSKQKQYEHEAEFAQGQKSEVERLRNELKDVWGEFKAEKAKLNTL